LGNIKGKNILEIVCGGAQNSIYFAKQGAKVTALDQSKEQLNFARKLAKKSKTSIEFNNGSFNNLHMIKSNSQDIVFSAFALQYSNNLKKCFSEVYRVLKKKGVFVFSLNHPFFRVVSSKSMKVKRSYFKTGKFLDTDGFLTYFHTISELFNPLIKIGFKVEKILEPEDNNKYPDPWRGL